MTQCNVCDRYLDTKDCKLREIAPKLTGCDGYGILSRTLVEKNEKEREVAIKKQEIQAKKNLAWISNIQSGDRVQLKGNPKSIVGCSNLPL